MLRLATALVLFCARSAYSVTATSDMELLGGALKVLQGVSAESSVVALEEKRNAEKLTKAIADRNPDNAPVQMAASENMLQAGEPKKALVYADNAVKIAPKDPRAYVHRGLAQFRACDFPAARADAQQALSLNPKDANAEA
ncbi:MAG: tetratricopeptide repeat protein, partial [Elusimicrobia bacterium]|nr:tetratricopeptide repeat protein [Elusimicrobiota bacterium]